MGGILWLAPAPLFTLGAPVIIQGGCPQLVMTVPQGISSNVCLQFWLSNLQPPLPRPFLAALAVSSWSACWSCLIGEATSMPWMKGNSASH